MVMRFRFPAYVLAAGAAVVLGGGLGCSDNAKTPNNPPDGGKTPPGSDAGVPVADAATAELPVQIKTLSNRADMISGGDALVELVLPVGTTADHLHVTLGSADISSAFAARAGGRILGLVTGLADGVNTLTADLGGADPGTLTITNHKIGGPVISGAQVTPFVCATPQAQAEAGTTPASNQSGLTTVATDAQCNIKTEIRLYYRSTAANCQAALPDPNAPTPAPANPCFKTYDPSAPAPADLATTTTDAGVTALHRARRARHAEPRHLRYRRAVRPDRRRSEHRVEAGRAAEGVERQGGLHVRRVERPAAPAVPLGAELDRRYGAVARLPGRAQQHDGLAVQRQPRDDERDGHDDEGEDRR
jgi:hypothetical protein